MLTLSNAPNCPAANTDRETVQFEVGKTYFARSACDSDCIFTAKVLSRTAKMVMVLVNDDRVKSCRVGFYDGEETIKPMGSYSMAPMMRAARFQS